MEISDKQKVTPVMLAEASAWVARLHGPARNPRNEAGFRTWLKAHPAHARAFEQTTEAWEVMGSVPAERLSPMVRWERVGRRRTRWAPLALAASVLLVIAAGFLLLRPAPLQTDIGEQRVVSLQDGTRVHLNTASALRVRYDARQRRVELQAGEALFEVARQAGRPFVVVAGGKQIVALGTSFVVRRDARRLSVTLMEGKVSIAPTTADAAAAEARILAPGERVIFDGARTPDVDRPPLEKVVAWQRGLVILDGMRLDEAAREMNRYSAARLEIASPGAAQLRISGAFRSGDSLSFAQAVARTYRLSVREEGGEIVLTGVPRATYR